MNQVHELIYQCFIKTPDKVAVIDRESVFTYNDLWKNVCRIGCWLSNNYEQGSRIAIMLDNSIESVLFVFGASFAKMISVPIDTNIHQRNLSYIVSDARPSLIITAYKYLLKFDGVKFEQEAIIILADNKTVENRSLLYLSDILNENIADNGDMGSRGHVPGDKDLIASILYTTGTTGPKKGVMLSHKNLLSATVNINKFMGIGSWAVECLVMPLSHSFGFARLRCVFDVGGTVQLENGLLRPERVLSNMQKNNANSISSVPAGFAILLDRYRELFEEVSCQIKYIEIGSAFMRKDHKEVLMKLCPNARICMHYGLTEASRAVFIEFHSEKDKLCTVGQPSPNVELKIVGDNGNQLGVDEIGEIQVKGEMVMRGYWNKQKLTEESLENGWLHTGDLGMVDFDGYVHLLGRENDVINIGGLKVAPGEVEEVLLKYKDILEVAVQGVASKDTISDVAIKAFIVCDGMVPSLDEIKKFCLQNLEPYKIPVQFELVNSLPKSSSGKIQKHLLIKENDG